MIGFLEDLNNIVNLKNMIKSLISIDELSLEQVNKIHSLGLKYFKNPKFRDNLKGKLLVNFFFENSTRTRLSFEIAALRMGARVANIDVSISSLKKGESIFDMARTINAMRPDFVAIRHNSSGIVGMLEPYFDKGVINAGEGANEHPTQALLDLFVIRQHKKEIKGLRVAICGDVLHSRVARSNIKLLSRMGAEISVVVPPTLVPKGYEEWLRERFGVRLCKRIEEGVEGVDVVMMLRIQRERMKGCYIPSLGEYARVYGLSGERLRLAKEDVVVLHPGPVNRGVEICPEVVDEFGGSLVLEQVEAGVAVRQGLLEVLG